MLALIWILIATFLVSLLGLVGLFSLWVKQKRLDSMLPVLVSFAAGALLGGAFFHLLAEAVEMADMFYVSSFALTGFVVALLIEGFFHSHLCEKCKAHPFTYTMLFGDAVHNSIDGLVIAASFMTSVTLGVVTSLMIAGHELPQEMGVFGALVYGGHERKKAVIYSFLAQSTVIIGGIAGFLAAKKVDAVVPFLLPFAAGGFIYIASADLVPEMHRMYRGNLVNSVKVLLPFAAGIAFMVLIKVFFEH
ncbi:ZIP family metal transporter [Candidatus Woesearchaeota archaeon]|nr:ZIP family metal transporter [Candidatus Woesearchaeota archaeon]